jgi:hypothetical protein
MPRPLWTNTSKLLLPFAHIPIPWITRNTGEERQITDMVPHHQETLAFTPRMGTDSDMDLDIHPKETGIDYFGTGEII